MPAEIVHRIISLAVASFVDDLIVGHLAPPKENRFITVCFPGYHGLHMDEADVRASGTPQCSRP